MRNKIKAKLVRMTAIILLLLLLTGAAPMKAVQTQSSLSDFVIVYPQGCGQTSYAYHAAILLQEKLFEQTGIQLELHDDSQTTAIHRILVGCAEDSPATYQTPQSDEYFISVSERLIILSGENQMLGAAVQAFATHCVQPDGNITYDIYRAPGRKEFYTHSDKARRVLYLIADGAGPEHYSWYNQTVSPAHFSGDDLPVQGMLKTDKYSGGTTDSAAAATALACGYKTAKGVVGMGPEKTVRYQNIRELLQAHGWRTAVMTTDEITGATPAGFTAHTDSRGNEEDISQQQALLLDSGMITALEGSLDDDSALQAVTTYLRQYDAVDGVFLMYEEAFIDKKSHDNDVDGMLHAVSRFDAVVAHCMVAAAADPDTLLIVTSDHETGGVRYDVQSGYSFTESGHTSADVRLMAMGPGAEYFNGQTLENTAVPSFLADTVAHEKLGDETAYKPVQTHTHSLIPCSESAATCQFIGQRAYFHCTTCGKYFLDEAAVREVSQGDLVLPIISHRFVDGYCQMCGIIAHSSISIVDTPFATVTADRRDADFGQMVTVQVQIAAGSECKAILVTDAHGNSISIKAVSGEVFLFTMPESSVSIQVLTRQFYTLHFDSNSGNPVPEVVADSESVVDLTSYMPTRAWYTFDGWYEDALFTKRVTHLTLSADTTVYAKWLENALPFTDVQQADYYYDSVRWALHNDVTQGTAKTTFSPDETCTRAQMVCFLWRATGEPKPESVACAFTDVKGDAYYYNAVLWAVENGITNGTSTITFSPGESVQRAQAATFLWRAKSCPESDGISKFADVVNQNAYYYPAVVWASANGITLGMSDDTFSPNAPCTRAQIATFLFRCSAAERYSNAK